MTKLNNISKWLLMFAAIVFAACSSEEVGTTVADDDDCYLTLSLNNAAISRAASDHPNSGENGDGSECGRNFENDIDNLCIFIYEDDGNGVNGTVSTPVKAKYYFGDLSLSLPAGRSYRTNPMKISGYKPTANDRIIVFANTGDVTADFSTLEDFQSTSKAWQKSILWNDNADPLKCNRFVMTSSKDDATYGKMNVTGITGTVNDPFNAEIEIQRTMARVDIMFKETNKATAADGPLTYVVDTGNSNSSGTFKLGMVRIFNMPSESTLPLKRVSSSADANGLNTATILGSEDTLPYVLTAWTCDKANEPYETATNFAASKGVGANGIATYLPDGTTDYNVHAYPADNRVFSVSETDFEDYKYCYTVGYCTENTMPIADEKNEYMTGLLLRGTFVPTTVYKCSSGALTAGTYTEGNDFWHYVALETGDESYFFSSEDDINAYINSRPDKAYSKVKYTHGQCYYYIWIKHTAPYGNYTTGNTPMEYAIVRNNIYRIGIDKVTAIGSHVPEPKNTVSSKIYVRNWRFRKQEEIVL